MPLPPTARALLQIHAERAAFDGRILDLVQVELDAERARDRTDGLTPLGFFVEGNPSTRDGLVLLPAGSTLRLISEAVTYAKYRMEKIEVLADAPIPLAVQVDGLHAGGTPCMTLSGGCTPLETWRQASPALRFFPEICAPNYVALHVRNSGPTDVKVRVQAQVRQLSDDAIGPRQ